MDSTTIEAIRGHLATIEAASNRMIGAALVKDMDVIVAAGQEISDSCEVLSELCDAAESA